MARTNNLTNFLTDVAGAIKEKLEDDTAIPASQFDTKILSIEGGIDTSDATATADDILQNKTAYVNTQKITGAIETVTEPKETGEGFDITTLSSDFSKWYTSDIKGILDISEEYEVCAIYNGSTISLYEYKNNAPTTKILDIPSSVYGGTSLTLRSVGFSRQLNGEGCLNIFIVAAKWDTAQYLAVAQYNVQSKTIVKNTKFNYNVASNDYYGAVNPKYPNVCAVANVPDTSRMHGLQWAVFVYNPSTNALTRTIFKSTTASTNVWLGWAEWDSTGKIVLFSTYKGNPAYISIIKITNETFTGYTSIVNRAYQTSDYYTLWNDEYYFKNNTLIKISDGSVAKTYSEFSASYGGSTLLFTNSNRLFVSDGSTYKCYKINSDLTLTQEFSIESNAKLYYISDLINGRVYFVNNAKNAYRSELSITDKYKQVRIKTDTLYNTDDANNLASDILLGKTYYGSSGKLVGTMPNNGILIYAPKTSVQNIPAGYSLGGMVTPVTSAIDENIIPENIKQNITILGVTGTYISTDIVLDIDNNASMSVSNETLIIEEVS